MIRRLVILLLVVGCDNSTEPELLSITGYPNQIGNSWTYECTMKNIDGETTTIGNSSLKIINDFPINYSNDYCGANTMIIEKVDSVFFNTNTLIELNNDLNDFPIDTVKIDTIIYSIEEDSMFYCLTASLLNNKPSVLIRLFPFTQPPNILYPLFIDKTWEDYEYEILKTYEIIDIENITTEIKSYSCFIIKLDFVNTEIYYYIASEGLIKSQFSSVVSPNGADEIQTITEECILIK